MTPLEQLQALANPDKAAEMAAYHKAARTYLGVSVPQIEELTDAWRSELSLQDRLDLAQSLWQEDIHECKVAAAKLLTQARIRPDDSEAWSLICQWVPQFDAWAIADHATIAGQKRLVAHPERIETVASWTTHPNMWTRRAALVITLPYAKKPFPKENDQEIRSLALTWAAAYVEDRDWFIQKSIAWWIRDLSKHDAGAASSFLDAHGSRLKSFARKEASRYLAP